MCQNISRNQGIQSLFMKEHVTLSLSIQLPTHNTVHSARMSCSPSSPQPTPIHKFKTFSFSIAQDKYYRNLSQFPQMEITPPARGLPSRQGQASHIIHHCSSQSLTINQPCAEGYLLGGSKQLSRHQLLDPGNSYPSAPIVPSLGVFKNL